MATAPRSRPTLPLVTLAVAVLVTPAQAAAPEPDPAADRCGNGLLGVEGTLVNGIGLVDAEAYKAGLFANRAKAIEAARADARQQAKEQLRAKVCGRLADPRDCDAEMTHLLQKEIVYEDRYACTVMAVEASALGSETAVGRANREITSLGQAVRAGLKDAGVQGAVALDIVRTPEQCSAVGLEAVRTQVGASLAGMELVEPGTGTWMVALEASQVGPQVQVAARLVDPSDPSGKRSRAVAKLAQFPSAAFGDVKLGGTCADVVRPRAGTLGLTAHLSLPTQLCAGQVFQPVLDVSRPARVQVWSVAPDGSALLLVPGDDGRGGRENGNWTGRRPLMESQAFPSSVPGDEMLVAVALPADAPVSASALPPNCKVARFDAARIPDGAAVAVQSWRVLDDAGHCPKAPDMHALATQVDDVLAKLPNCW